MIKFVSMGVMEYVGYNETHVTDYELAYRKNTQIPVYCSTDRTELYFGTQEYLRFTGFTTRLGKPDSAYSVGKNSDEVLEDMTVSFLKLSSSFVTKNIDAGNIVRAKYCRCPNILTRLNFTDRDGKISTRISHLSVFTVQSELYDAIVKKTNKSYEQQRDIYEYYAKTRGKQNMNFISQVLAHMDSAGYAFIDSFTRLKRLKGLFDVKNRYCCSLDFYDKLIERYGDEAQEYFENVFKNKDHAKELKLYWEDNN